MQSSSVEPKAILLLLLLPPLLPLLPPMEEIPPPILSCIIGQVELPKVGDIDDGAEKKKGNWRLSCKDLKLGKADMPVFLAAELIMEGAGGGWEERSKVGWCWWLKAVTEAAAEAAAAMVEKQDTCSCDGAWLS